MLRGQRSDPGKWSLGTRYGAGAKGRSSGALLKCAAASDEDQVTVELLKINGRRRDVSCSRRAVSPPCDWLVGGASLPGLPACLSAWAGAAGDCIPSRLPGGLSHRSSAWIWNLHSRGGEEGGRFGSTGGGTEERCCTASGPRCHV